MRTTSLTGAMAPAVFPLILLAFSGAPTRAQDTGTIMVQPAETGPSGDATPWTWAELTLDAPESEPSVPASKTMVQKAAPVPAGGLNTRVSRVTNANGGGSVTAAGSFTDWTFAEFGVDMSLVPAQRAGAVPYVTSTTTAIDGSGAVAWARTTIPGVSNFMVWDKGSVDVRLDALQDQSTLATTFSRQWSLMDNLTASVSDAYSFVVAGGGTEQWQTGKSVSLNLTQSGTSVSVGTSANSSERGWLPSVSASQKLIGPMVVTTTVADNGDTMNKSVSAGFRRSW